MLQAIKKTLAYASIFDYPLTSSEIHHWLIGKQVPLKEVKRLDLPKQNFTERKKKAKIAVNKWTIAKKASVVLSKIPTILSILVTGNLSMDNSSIDDDIDFLIITKTNSLWTTRFFANLILDILKTRRHPKDKTYKDKICLNIFIDVEHLKITDQNLYTAHELLQAKPIFDKNSTYQKFISANSWAEKYLPNAYSASSGLPAVALAKAGVATSSIFFSFFEPFFSFLQKQYMASKITKEKILPGQLLFHPKNTKNNVLKKYKSLLTKHNSPYKIAVVSNE